MKPEPLKLSGKTLQNIALGQAFFGFDLEAQTTAATLTNGITSKDCTAMETTKRVENSREGRKCLPTGHPAREDAVKWTNLKPFNCTKS